MQRPPDLHHKSKLIAILITTSLFLFSLGSYYFYNVELYLLQFVGVLIVLPLFRLKYIDIGKARLGGLAVFFFYAFIVGTVFALIYNNNIFQFSKLAIPVFFCMWLAFAAIMFRGYPLIFHKALRRVILIHVGCFIFQFFCYIFTSQFIDFLEPITGEPQRAFGGSYEISFIPIFFRATGLYNEPGTYSTWLIILLLLYKDNRRRLGIFGNDRMLEFLVIGTILLSFSTFGLVFSILYIISIIIEKGFNLRVILIVALLSTPFIYVGFEFLDQRMALGSEGAGLGFRYQAMDLYQSGLNVWNAMFGLGMFTDFFARADSELVYLDVGFWFVLVTSVGATGLLMFCYFLFTAIPRNIVSLTLISTLLLSKLAMTNALIWFVLFYFIWAKFPVRLFSLENK